MLSLRLSFTILARRPWRLAALVATSLVASIAEGAGLGLIIGLLPGGPLGDGAGRALAGLPGFPTLFASGDAVSRTELAAVLLFLTMLVRGCFYYAARMLAAVMEGDLVDDLRSRVFTQLLALEADHVHAQPAGRLFTTLISHTDAAGHLLRDAARSIVDLFTVAVYGALLFVVSWRMTAITVLLLGILTVAIRWTISRKLTRSGERVARARETMESVGLEGLAGLEVIHLYGREPYFEARFHEASRAHERELVRQHFLVNVSRPAFVTANGLALSLLILGGAYLYPDQAQQLVGYTVLFLAIAFRLLAPAAALSEAHNVVESLSPAVDEVLRFLARTDRARLRSGSTRFEGLSTGVRLVSVGFRYRPGEPEILHDVSFEIPKGQVVALVGESGQGKTTIVKLIARLFDCTSGEVLADGVDVRTLDLASWRSKLAVVSQDAFLFHDTIQANLRLVRPDASEGQLRAAAVLAGADEFIGRLPQGYATVVGHRGTRLSGGQRQLIALARALLVEPDVLILDEATSQLDAQSEQSVRRVIETIRPRSAVLVVAHRLSTVRDADAIVVIDKGRIVERGAPEELLARAGAYARMVDLQQPGVPYRAGER